ncbi:MAG: hypothetical protein KF901_07305 [Myxococcales bacterium]|nr:hypothetical protein [Myxococcales bacterium]
MRTSVFLSLSWVVACGGASATTAPTVTPPTSPQHASRASGALIDAAAVATEGALPPLPIGLTSFGLASVGGDVYLLGGYHGEPHRYEAAGQSNVLYVLRDRATRWERAATIDVGLQSVALANVAGAAHRVGGMKVEGGVGGPEGDGTGTLRSVADHARFDPSSGAWTALPPLPEPRSSHDAIALGEDLYVVGGWRIDGAPTDGTYASTMLRFRGGAWESLPQPFRRRALGLAATQRHLVAVGGLSPEGVSQAVSVYDVVSEEWSEGPALPGDHTGFGVAVLGVGEDVLACGRDGVIRRWRVGEPGWTEVSRLAFPRFFHRMVPVAGGEIAVVGGIGSMHTHGRTRVVERLDAGGRAPRVVLHTLPWDGAAKNRQGMFVVGDHLYLFGGNDSLGQHDFEVEHFVSEGWRVHLSALTREPRAPYPVRRQTMTTLVLPGDEPSALFVAGFGHESPTATGEEESVAVTHPEVYSYDVARDRWSLRASLPVPRSQTSVAVHEGTLFVLGGLDYDSRRPEHDQFRHLTEIVSLAPGAEAFTTLDVALPGPRRAFGGATHEGVFYLVGGMREAFTLVDDCVAFELATRTFGPLPCPAAPRLNPQLVRVDGKLVLVGGTTRLEGGELGEDRSIEIFDPSTGRWSRAAAELPFTPKHAQAFAWNGRLLVVSTHSEDAALRLALLDLH